MNRWKSFLSIPGIILVLSAFMAGCGGEGAWQILKQNPTWMAQITRMNLGPDEYYEGEYKYGPQKDGEGFIWVHLTLNNQTSAPLSWDHTKVILKAGNISQDPFRVLQTDGMNQSPVKETEKIAPGSYAQRILIYSFPRNERPRTITIGPLGEAPIPEDIIFLYK